MAYQDSIYRKVSAVLGASLNVDEEVITPTSTLQGDLGAESIDFLDIVFRLERAFDIKIPRDELFPELVFARLPGFGDDGRVTPKGVQELRTGMPFANLTEVAKSPEVSNIANPVTVQMIMRYIEGKLGARAN
jgi:acyl carrier protein